MKFKFASWNIDTNLSRTEEGYARESHPEWRIKNRMLYICAKINKINADILNIQELKKTVNKHGELIDSLTPLKDYLEVIGYGVLIQPYNNINDKVFQFITAYKKDKFEVIDAKLKYFTKTPNMPTLRPNTKGKNPEEFKMIKTIIKNNNYGEFFERGTFVTYLKHIETGENLIDFNIHLGMPLAHRLVTSGLINEFVIQELIANPNAKIVVGGDFNSFPGPQGTEQIEMIKNAMLNGKTLLDQASDKLYLPNKEPAPENNTFIFFPFDFGTNDLASKKEDIDRLPNLEAQERKKAIAEIFKKDNCLAIGGQLDHVFVHGLIKIGQAIVDVTPQFEPGPKSYDNQDVKNYILKHHHQGPAFASDHQPIIVELIASDIEII